MRTCARKRRNERIQKALCIHCGKRPSFWGRRCVICRQAFSKDPLPSGARRALRLYRAQEAKRQREEIERGARAEVLKLLRGTKVKGKHAEALQLYSGLDIGSWRTYEEVARRMKLSKERVRQLLQPSKVVLARILHDRVPWKPIAEKQLN
jgi:hypothetical protein